MKLIYMGIALMRKRLSALIVNRSFLSQIHFDCQILRSNLSVELVGSTLSLGRTAVDENS